MHSQTVYSLTYQEGNYVTEHYPNMLPDNYYSLVRITYNKDEIVSIHGTYFGENDSETTECTFSEWGIGSVLVSNDPDVTNYLSKIKSYTDQLNDGDKTYLTENRNISESITSSDDILTKIFMIDCASMLVYFHFILTDQESIGYPFYPVQIKFPEDTIDLSVLDQNVFEYISYSARILLSMNTQSIGKLWLVQLLDFWDVWGPLFPQSLEISIDKEEIIYVSLIKRLTQYIKGVENIVTDGSDQLREMTFEVINLIRQSDHDIKNKFKYASLLLTTVGTMVLKAIKVETDAAMGEIESAREKNKLELERRVENFKERTEQSFVTLTSVETEIRNSLETIQRDVNEYSDRKAHQIKREFHSVQNLVHDYSDKYIEELKFHKNRAIERLYQEIPKIIEDEIESRVEFILNEIISEYKSRAKIEVHKAFNKMVTGKGSIIQGHIDNELNEVKYKIQEYSDATRQIAIEFSEMRKLASLEEIGRLQREVRDMGQNFASLTDIVARMSETMAEQNRARDN